MVALVCLHLASRVIKRYDFQSNAFVTNRVASRASRCEATLERAREVCLRPSSTLPPVPSLLCAVCGGVVLQTKEQLELRRRFWKKQVKRVDKIQLDAKKDGFHLHFGAHRSLYSTHPCALTYAVLAAFDYEQTRPIFW